MAQAKEYSDVRVVRLKEVEHEADGITHKTYEKMHKTFLTPIDREDIYALVNKMDSIGDVIEATAVRIHFYKVKRTSDEIIKQAQILNDAIKKGSYINKCNVYKQVTLMSKKMMTIKNVFKKFWILM